MILKYKEKFDTLLEARRREAAIKTWPRAKKESLINENASFGEKVVE